MKRLAVVSILAVIIFLVSDRIAAPAPVTIESIIVNQSVVVGGTGVTGTVWLSGINPRKVVVLLSSSNSSVAEVPSSVTIPAKKRTVNFSVITKPQIDDTPVMISGTYNGLAFTELTVNKARLIGLTLNPSTVVGGESTTGTVLFDGPVAVDAVVTLTVTDNSVTAIARRRNGTEIDRKTFAKAE